MQLGIPEIISKSQRERLIIPNIAFMRVFQLFGTTFLMKLKRTYNRSISLNVK